jgi:tetratricopeptide (TPR) repeat protein
VRALDNKPNIAESLYLLGSLARSRGDLDQASALWEESRAMDQAAGVRAGYVLIALAHLARERGEYGEAARLLGIRLRETHEIGEEIILGDLMRQIAEMALAMGQPERAARLGGASATQKEALARRTGILRCVRRCSTILLMRFGPPLAGRLSRPHGPRAKR